MVRVFFRKLLNVLFLFCCLSFTVMPVRVCTAFTVQPVQLVTAKDKAPLPADVVKRKVKSKPKAKVSVQDGEYKVIVDRNAMKKSSKQSEEKDTASKVKNYINLHFKYIGQYILFGIMALCLKVYTKKYRK